MEELPHRDSEVLSVLLRRIKTIPLRIITYITGSLPRIDLELKDLLLYGERNFITENLDASPAIYIREFGFWTIGRSSSGKMLCLEIETGVIFSVYPEVFVGPTSRGRIVGLRNEAGRLIRNLKCDKSSIDRVITKESESFDDLIQDSRETK
jgi:hypothetical protein